MTAFIPLGRKVLIQRKEPPKMVGSIYLPSAAQENNQHGIVVALGVGKDDDGKDLEFNVKTGDTVLLPTKFLNEVEVDGVSHILIPDDQIVAVIEEE